MNKGKISAEIKGSLVKDPESKWDKSHVWRFLRDIYNKYIIPARVETQEDKVMGDVKDVKEDVKSFLELQGRR